MKRTYNKVVCNYCNKLFSNTMIQRHSNVCLNNLSKVTDALIKKERIWNCTLCNDGRFFSFMGLTNHINLIHNGIREKISIIQAKRRAEGKYKKSTGICNDPLKETERRNKISSTMKINKRSGGYRKGSGVGKSGWYKGYWCDSSWELAFVIYNIDHHIEFKRNTQKFEYVFEDKIRYFIPDFIVNNKFVEIKGYNSKQWQAKINQFKEEIEILDINNIGKYIYYVSNTYSSDFIKMYENNGK